MLQRTRNDVALHDKETNTMTRRTTLSALGDFIDVFGSAVAVSRALEAKKRPLDRDLVSLGIDPAQFRRIGH